jgi:hypothetical protein
MQLVLRLNPAIGATIEHHAPDLVVIELPNGDMQLLSNEAEEFAAKVNLPEADWRALEQEVYATFMRRALWLK